MSLLAIIVSLLLVFLTITTIVQALRIKGNYLAISLMENIITNHLKIQKIEKDFLQQDVVNTDFFLTKSSHNTKRLDSIHQNSKLLIGQLTNNKTITSIEQERLLEKINEGFATVSQKFDILDDAIFRKGFKDYGLEGEMREKIHTVEKSIANADNLKLQVMMLTLRRHEKDFLLRNDMSYRTKFDEVALNFLALTANDKSDFSKEVTSNIKAYQTSFHKLVEIQTQLGFGTNKGIINELSVENEKLANDLSKLQDQIKEGASNQITRSINVIVVIALIFFTLILLIIFRVSKYINKSINHLKEYITKLGKGELPNKIESKNDDEIGDMVNSINVLTQNLKNTKEFAIEVGNGNLETEVNVFNNEGDLGNSLVEMRNRLLKVSKERELFEVENQQRNWVNEGIARFSEILRLNHQTMEDIAYQLLSSLIDYLEANQGAIYLVADKVDESEPTILELVSAIAYGRRKHIKDSVEIGEDIIGRCAYELKTIYMTDVPDNFIKITSGLGTANPRAVLVVPFVLHDQIFGVLEIASFKNFEKFHIDFAERIAVNIATTISHVKINKNTERLLRQAQIQSEEIASQEEELRQNMEEMQATQEESARRESELTSTLFVYNSAIATLKTDFRGIIIFANDLATSIIGINHETIIGRKISSVFNSSEDFDEHSNLWNEVIGGEISSNEITLSSRITNKKFLVKFFPQTSSNNLNTIIYILIFEQGIKHKKLFIDENELIGNS